MVVVHRLGKIADGAVPEGSVPGGLIGVCGHEDREDRVPVFDEVFV
jgi:hypothetical protein